MSDSSENIIYIGKAKRLRQRIRHYFLPSVKDPKTRLLRTRIAAINFIATATEADALVLERQLIQKHQPEFNIILKDDKSFPVLRISKREPFPKLEVVRSMGDRGYAYFGPFPSMGSIRQFMKLIHALFPVRDCHQRIDAVSKQPKCIKLDMGTCLGPCIYKDTHAYTQMIQALSTFLNGNRAPIVAKLTNSMQTVAN
ncbi:MAG: GIY-YIG nuclease family protein, partial [Candidatus Marinamargulisbacteria bacterium]|nr:GIY-YIG nuclease family protein [Candidatus Marinamargulisbacteria bacterium]